MLRKRSKVKEDMSEGNKKARRNRIIRRVCSIISIVAFIASCVLMTIQVKAAEEDRLSMIQREITSGAVIVQEDFSGIYEEVKEEIKTTHLEDTISLAESKLECRYVHATAGPDTFDCQGFVHYVFTHCNAKVKCYVPRGGCTNQLNAIKQYQISDDPKDAERGDIVYFYGGGRWKHVGIALGDGKLIHATTIGPGKSCVKITDMPDWYNDYAVVRVLE